MTPTDDKSIEALEAIFEDAAKADAKDPSKITPEDRAWADKQRAQWKARIAEARRELALPGAEPSAPPPIRAKYQAMNRDALLAAFVEASQRMGGQLQVAHRNLSDLSDDDLRRLLETLDAQPE